MLGVASGVTKGMRTGSFMLSELKFKAVNTKHDIILAITTGNKMGFLFTNGFHKRGQISEWKD